LATRHADVFQEVVIELQQVVHGLPMPLARNPSTGGSRKRPEEPGEGSAALLVSEAAKVVDQRG
jgi:hypothetical protein